MLTNSNPLASILIREEHSEKLTWLLLTFLLYGQRQITFVKSLPSRLFNTILVKFGPPPQLLICIFGILHCGRHGIPIELWLPRSFPREAPMIFVTPSPGIPLKPTTMVDATGRVHHPYGLSWINRPDSSVVELLRMVANALSMDPPFYPGTGRPSPTPGNVPDAAQFRPQTGPPAYASTYGSPGPLHHSQSPSSSHGSPLTAKPPAPISSLSDAELREKATQKLKSIALKSPGAVGVQTDKLLAESELLQERGRKLETAKEHLVQEVSKMESELEELRQLNRELQTMSEGDIIKRLSDIQQLVQPANEVSKQYLSLRPMTDPF